LPVCLFSKELRSVKNDLEILGLKVDFLEEDEHEYPNDQDHEEKED
jgi:hypothetical protein